MQPRVRLRDYQLDAVRAVQTYLEYREGHPVCVLPCGAGKSLVIAAICEWLAKYDLRVLVVSHVAELLEQNCDKLMAIAPSLDCGIYSAGLGLRQTDRQVTFCGVQSVFNRAEELGEVAVVIVDEAHAINDDENTMYGQLIASLTKLNPKLRVVGMTATPWRTSSGPIAGPGKLFAAVCHEVPLRRLVDEGWLSPLRSKRVAECDTSKLGIVAGEFNGQQVADLMLPKTEAAVKEILARTVDCKTVLIFATNVAQAEQVTELIPGSRLILGDTDSDLRSEVLSRTKAGEIKYLVNCRVLTTGTDLPSTDAIAVLFPTASPGLWMQIVGRGMRLSEGKQHATVLDFGSNIERFGPIYKIRPPVPRGSKGKKTERDDPQKFCPTCDEAVPASSRSCHVCGYEFPETEVKTSWSASNADISGDEEEVEELPVYDVRYARHLKKGGTPDDPPTLRVEYVTRQGAISSWVKNAVVMEWVCVEHTGFARQKAELWWRARSNDPMPNTVDRAIDIALGGGLAIPSKVYIKPDGKYTRIVKVELGEKPEAAELCVHCNGAGCDECKFEFETSGVSDDGGFDFGEAPF